MLVDMLKSAFITLFLVSWAGFCLSQTSRRAERGVVDLGDVTFTNHEIVALEGRWEFYSQQLLTPADSVREYIQSLKYLTIPNVWSFYGLPSKGYGTYRLKVRLPEAGRDRRICRGRC